MAPCDRYAAHDSYTYPGTDVLVNRLGIRDARALHEMEHLVALARSLSGVPEGGFDYAHLKAIHRHLFQDLYDWAGEERSVSIQKGSTRFATPAYLGKNAARLFKALHDQGLFTGLRPEEFADKAGAFFAELNILHPFREGNGRAMRIFLRQLAQRAGHALVPEQLDRERWHAACVAGVLEHGPMAALLLDCIAAPADQG